ncbi:MAG: T9SS type A sorting domain-containing protein [Bacteroidales bacterium]|nr:T9SS type A sorting domain-containing protein [Bacteroidales bacterium]MCB9013888.1 T9SS type A sorting domain-containing protein [Bacteroidales bacterium]
MNWLKKVNSVFFALSIGLLPLVAQNKIALSLPVVPYPSATAPGYSPLEEEYDVSFYFIDLEVSNKSNFIKGSSGLTAKSLVSSLDTFVVELSSKLSVDSVFLFQKRRNDMVRTADLIKLPLNEGEKANKDISLKIYYHGNAGSGGFFSGLSSSTSFDWNQRVTYTLAEPFLAKDFFAVKQNLRDKADSSWVFITVDSSLMAGSNGLLKDVTQLEGNRKRYEWKSSYPIAYYLISFSVADYIDYSFYARINEKDSILVQNFIYNSPGILDSLKTDIDRTADFLRLYTEDFGPYPFIAEKYGHCMAPIGGGMEHQTMTTITSFDFGLVSHELAHMWFGDYLTCGTWQDIWINEGFASYAEYLALKKLQSDEAAKGWLVEAHNYALNYPYQGVYLTPLEATNVSRIFNYGLTYKKGGSILHMLRYEINNDSVFFNILKQYLKEFRYGNPTGEDFRKVVEEVSGQDYGWFFNQWYYGKGFPVFVCSWRQTGDSLILAIQQTSSAGDKMFFRTHLEFKIKYQSGETQNYKVLFDKSSEVFRFNVNDEVSSVQIDPNADILMISNLFKYADVSKVFSANPNPVKDELNIAFRTSSKTREIRLSDLNGRMIINQTSAAGSIRLDLTGLNSGIYLLNITEDGNTYTEKIVKQ